LASPNNPFGVQIWVKGRERKGDFRGNDYYVPLRKNEEFEIWVENRSGQLVCMRLLVDGLNTLPEKDRGDSPSKPPSSDATPEPASPAQENPGAPAANAPPKQIGIKGLITEIIGKPIADLETARHWVIDPKDRRQVLSDGRNVVAIRGFTTRTGVDGEIARFKVVDASQSLAARKNFTSQLGLITVAFYNRAGGSRSAGGIGVDAGRREGQNLKEREGVEVGQMLEVVHIRYYDPDAPKPAGG
jgi:hypothetical protein